MSPTIEIREPERATEAFVMIGLGLVFLFWGKKKVVSVMWTIFLSVTTTLWFTVGQPVLEKWATDTVQIKEATPRMANNKPSSSTFSLMPQAFADGKKNLKPIEIKGKFWAYEDTNFRAWKILGEQTVLVYDKEHDRVFELLIPELEERIHEQKK